MTRGKSDRSQLIALADDIFSFYIRHRDGWKCVVCGKSKAQGFVMQNGHVISRKCLALKYDEKNCHCQCSGCNKYHTHRPERYYAYFIHKYGEKKFYIFEAMTRSVLGLGGKPDNSMIIMGYLKIMEKEELMDFEKEILMKYQKKWEKLKESSCKKKISFI